VESRENNLAVIEAKIPLKLSLLWAVLNSIYMQTEQLEKVVVVSLIKHYSSL